MHTASNGTGTANLTVVIRPEPTGSYTAQVVELPELRATAPTPDAALEQVQGLLNAATAETSWRQVTVPLSDEHSPALKWFGHAQNDPDFEAYHEAIRTFRQQADDQARAEDEAG